MKIPKEINAYCPKCRKHTPHKIAKVKHTGSPDKPGPMTWGARRHERRIKGYVGSVAGKAKHITQSHRNLLILECSACRKRRQRVLGRKTKKKAEFKKE